MLKRISISAVALLLAGIPQAHASSSGLFINDDSVQFRHNSDTIPLLGVATDMAFNVMDSNDPGGQNFMLSGELAFPDHAWEFLGNQSITPRIDLMAFSLAIYNLSAAAAGASYRLAPSERHRFDVVAEVTLAPPLTTLGSGRYVWTFKTQLNYPIADKVDLNFGYRTITIKLRNNFVEGFERGLYFGITTQFD